MKRRGFIFSALALLTGCKYGPVSTSDGKASTFPYRQKFAHGDLDVIDSELLYARLQVALYMQYKFPFIATCERCGFPWAIVAEHSTSYEQGHGVFCLCEDCWRNLAAAEWRLPYYRRAWEKYWKETVPFEAIQKALEEESKVDAEFRRKQLYKRLGVTTQDPPIPANDLDHCGWGSTTGDIHTYGDNSPVVVGGTK